MQCFNVGKLMDKGPENQRYWEIPVEGFKGRQNKELYYMNSINNRCLFDN